MTTVVTPEQRNGHRPMSEDLNRTKAEARELGSEIADIVADLRTLAQKEAELAKAEMSEQASRTARGAIFGVVAALFAIVMLNFLFYSIMLGLTELFQPWAAALITAGIALVLTGILAYAAYAMLSKISIVPQRTKKTLQEDVAWARSQLNSSAR